MVNKFHKGLLFFLVTTILWLSSCAQSRINPEKYTSYICYDYHLACLNVENGSAAAKITYREVDGTEGTAYARFRKISEVSDDQFVYASVSWQLLIGYPQRVIMQNPDKYVDVLQTWTIEKIEIFSPEMEWKQPALVPDVILDSTSEIEYFNEFKEFFFDSSAKELNASFQDRLDDPYYIRIHFSESDVIVWDTKIFSYSLEESQNRIICLDRGRERPFSSYDRNMVPIDEDTNLYRWILGAIE